MAAMRIVPPIRYDLGLVGLSVAIAVAASTFSLWSFYWLQSPDLVSVFWKKVGSALILGSAIYGMHYTGMMAASFAPDTRSVVDVHWALNPWILAVMLGAVSIVFLLGVLLISTYEEVRAGRLELRTAQLRRVAVRAENQVRDLSGRLVELQDAERRRLASELHDIVGQNLSALTTELAMLRNRSVATGASDLQRDLEDVSELAKQSVEAVRKVMAQLRPPGLDELGLAAALRWHAQAFESRTGIAVRVDIDESVPKPGALLEDALLRIYLEALTNIAKHAEAREVQVTLESRGERVTLAIADDGHGFAVESYQPGEGERWGLALMQERAAAMGGELQVRSAPVRGTEVVFSISKKLWS